MIIRKEQSSWHYCVKAVCCGSAQSWRVGLDRDSNWFLRSQANTGAMDRQLRRESPISVLGGPSVHTSKHYTLNLTLSRWSKKCFMGVQIFIIY